MFNFKNFLLYFLLLLISLLGFIVIANLSIVHNARGKTYDNIEDIPINRVGLVLGTSKKVQSGRVNLYFKYRIDAVEALFKQKKIEFVLVSGDNGTQYYDEPNDIKKALIKRGIPEDKIFLDYAGFRTLDSMVRAKKVFGLNQFTVISQKFHNERAIYLAEQYELEVIGFNAEGIHGRYGFKTKLREYLARSKVFIDIIFNVQPKFLGKKIEIQ